ncbi:hypothetical protein [Pseudomonas fluorescens]|uniref:hypothetical protein n=1 Tax=Pseudomonas fluorescens TaxID=294 RepID=UPI0018DEE392|nr:hypothetical protein [Pseudomonas fluorescens]
MPQPDKSHAQVLSVKAFLMVKVCPPKWSGQASIGAGAGTVHGFWRSCRTSQWSLSVVAQGQIFEVLKPYREQAHSYKGMHFHVGVSLLAKAAQAALEISLGNR